MNKLKFLLLLSCFISTFGIAREKNLSDEKHMIVMNMEDSAELPRNFRMTLHPIEAPQGVNLYGLKTLNASGSGQFSENSFLKLLSVIPNSRIIVVDLREESHGFINKNAVSWYADYNLGNLKKPLTQIQEEEKELLNETLKNGQISYFIGEDTSPKQLKTHAIATEESLIKSRGKEYFRLPVTDHRSPRDETVDTFIAFFKTLPKDAWLHFHCSAGKGRTSTFMVMYDMMRNGSHVSFEDILKRQQLIGGKDFSALPDPKSWKYDSMLDRIEFLRIFYQYCRENPEFKQTWSSWLKSQSEEVRKTIE